MRSSGAFVHAIVVEKQLHRYHAELDNGRKMGIKKVLFSGTGLGLTNFIILSVYGLAFWLVS